MGTLCSHSLTEASSSGDMGYAFWQRWIAETFLRRETPVVLFIDDDELRHMLPGVDDPAARLSKAVAEEVNVPYGRYMFHRLYQKQRTWQRSNQRTPPPTLPLLALTVLAATRMRRDMENPAHSFYIRLAQALVPGADVESQQHMRTALREGIASIQIAGMWRVLHEWLCSTHGEFGISTLPARPEPARIGYPLSQAVLRRVDRAELTRFFSAVDLRTHGVPDADTLLSQLELWMSRPRGFSPAFQEMVGDPSRVQLLIPTITRLAQHWDGHIVTSDGLRRLEFRLVLDLRRHTAKWAVASADGVDEDVLRGEIGGEKYEVTISRDPYSKLYELDTVMPVTPHTLQAGFQLRGKRSSAYFAPATVVVFAEDPDAGAWLSCPSVIPYEPHMIAVSDDMLANVERVLTVAADPGWRIVRHTAGRPLLRGWRIIESVTFSDQGRLEKALSETPVLRTTAVRPDTVARPQLTQGLPLVTTLGRNFYLCGGEPDLLLPSGDRARKVEAALDGVRQEPPFSAFGFPIPLSKIGPLSTGKHELDVEGQRLTFHVLDSVPGNASSRWGLLGWDPRAGLSDVPPSFEVCGADVPGPDDQEPVLARRGQDETWLLHDDGICQAVREPPAAPVSAALHTPPYYFEIDPDSTVVWLAQRRDAHWRVQLVKSCPPAFTRLDRESLALWHELAVQHMPESPLWDEYLRELERCCGR